VEFRILGGGVLTSSLVDEIEQLKKRITALEQAIEIVEEPDFEVALEKARRFFDGSRGQKYFILMSWRMPLARRYRKRSKFAAL
jgi:hypothetical protein